MILPNNESLNSPRTGEDYGANYSIILLFGGITPPYIEGGALFYPASLYLKNLKTHSLPLISGYGSYVT